MKILHTVQKISAQSAAFLLFGSHVIVTGADRAPCSSILVCDGAFWPSGRFSEARFDLTEFEVGYFSGFLISASR